MSYIDKTSVPTLTWQDTGIALLEESAILQGVMNDFQNAFGNSLKFHNANNEFLLSTPQGQLATSIAALISDRNRLLAYYVNQVDPSYAIGRMQDGIGRIYFIERIPPENTKVVAVCSGATGVQIPQGTQVKDTSGNIYTADSTKTIGDDGTVEISFTCVNDGPVACPAGTLTQMYQLIQGWDSITNPKEGILGRYVENQAQFEQRRRQSVAKNSLNSVDSIMASLLSDVDIIDAYVTDNDESRTVTIGSVPLKPHSLYVCVAALDSEENRQKIATIIFNKKPPGCDMNGDTQVTIQDDQQIKRNGQDVSLYSTPPNYLISFSFAIDVAVTVKIVLARPQFMPSDGKNQIIEAIYSAFTGQDGSERPRIGSQILASQFYSPVLLLGTWARIRTLQIGRDSATGDTVKMGIHEMPVLNKSDIEVMFDE